MYHVVAGGRGKVPIPGADHTCSGPQACMWRPGPICPGKNIDNKQTNQRKPNMMFSCYLMGCLLVIANRCSFCFYNVLDPQVWTFLS